MAWIYCCAVATMPGHAVMVRLWLGSEPFPAEREPTPTVRSIHIAAVTTGQQHRFLACGTQPPLDPCIPARGHALQAAADQDRRAFIDPLPQRRRFGLQPVLHRSE